VLKPASPVPPGKKVRCPKCKAIFVAGEDEEGAEDEGQEEPEESAKEKVATAPGAKAKAKAKPAAEAKKKADEEEEEGAYSLVRDEEDEDKEKISYAPDTSIKDLRGPAVAALMSPTNWLIRSGFVGVFGCITLILLLAIPALLPVHEDDNPESRPALPMRKINPGFGNGNPLVKQGGGFGGGMPQPPAGGGGGGDDKKDQPKEKLQEEPSAGYIVYWYDWGSLCDMHWSLFLVCMIPFLLLGCYSGAIAFGGIKAQNLESRGWGMAASIMAMLPLNTFCPIMALVIIFKCLVYLFLEVNDDLTIWLVGLWMFVCHAIYLLSLGSGIWSLITLNKPEVTEGFEYEGE
jgi:hypothetical protein